MKKAPLLMLSPWVIERLRADVKTDGGSTLRQATIQPLRLDVPRQEISPWRAIAVRRSVR